MARLTQAEQRIIKYPPTPRTWLCTKKRPGEDQALRECGMANSGNNKECLLCRSPRPSKPKLLWPVYLAACKKAGIEPKEKPA